jgi:hypothetical protein
VAPGRNATASAIAKGENEMTMYIYNAETMEVVATITRDSNEECETVASGSMYDEDLHGWTYADHGLIITDETVEL